MYIHKTIKQEIECDADVSVYSWIGSLEGVKIVRGSLESINKIVLLKVQSNSKYTFS